MSKTLQRIAIISAGLVILGFLSGCGDGSQAPSASPLPTPIPELTPSPADTPASPSADSGVVALTSATSSNVAVPGTSARFALIYQWLLRVSPSQAVLVRVKALSHQWLVPLLVGATVSGDSPVTVRPETLQGTGIEAMSITAPGGTTAGALTLPTRTWFPRQSGANELLWIPIPIGLPERYLLKITDDLLTTVAPKIDVQ